MTSAEKLGKETRGSGGKRWTENRLFKQEREEKQKIEKASRGKGEWYGEEGTRTERDSWECGKGEKSKGIQQIWAD